MIKALCRDASGLCHIVELALAEDGAILDTYGEELEATDVKTEIKGWGSLDGPAVEYRTFAGVGRYLIPQQNP